MVLIKKKILASLLIILVLSVSLSGCISNEDQNEPEQEPNNDEDVTDKEDPTNNTDETNDTNNDPVNETDPNGEDVSGPPNFQINNIDLDPKIIEVDTSLSITASVRNLGGEGSRELKLFFNNELIKTRTVELEGNQEKTISFNYVPSEVGIHTFKLLNQTAEVEVVPLAKFNYDDLRISNQIIEEGEETKIQVKVQNTREAKGIDTIELFSGDEKIDEKEIILDPKETRQISFIKSFDAGDHQIKIEGLSRSLKVLRKIQESNEVSVDYLIETEHGSKADLVLNITGKENKGYIVNMITGSTTKINKIFQSQMDGFAQVRFNLLDGKRRIESGPHTLLIKDNNENELYETEISFNGPKLKIKEFQINKELMDGERLGGISEVTAEITNIGDLPVNVDRARIRASGVKSKNYQITGSITSISGSRSLEFDTSPDFLDIFGSGEYRVYLEFFSVNDNLLTRSSRKINFVPRQNLYVESLSINPNEVSTGENVYITGKVVNSGREAAQKTLDLLVDGEVVESRDVELGSQQSTKLEFEVSREDAKEYTVKLGNKVKSFTVKDPDSSSETINYDEDDGFIWVYPGDIIKMGNYRFEPLDISETKNEFLVEASNPSGDVNIVTVPGNEYVEIWDGDITIYVKEIFRGAAGTIRAQIKIIK